MPLTTATVSIAADARPAHLNASTMTVVADRPVFYSGSPLYQTPQPFDPDGTALPHVNQAGLVDGNDDPVTEFAYIMTGELAFASKTGQFSTIFQVFTSQTTFEVSLLREPDVAKGVAASAASAAASAVASAASAAEAEEIVLGDADTVISGLIDDTGSDTYASLSASTKAIAVRANRDLLRTARVRLAACVAGVRRFDMVCIGTSITEGEIATTMPRRWVEQVQAGLRAQFQPQNVLGGEGYVPGFYAGPQIEANAMTDRWTGGGTNVTTYWGLGYRARELTAGTNASMTFFGTGLDIFMPHGPGAGTATITIDGTTHGTENCAAGSAAAGFYYQVRNLRPGTHTVNVAASGGTVTVSGAMVYNGDSSAGVHVWEAGHAGYSSSQMNARNYPYQDLAAYNPSLVVIEPFANDYLNSVSTATSKSALEGIIAKVRANVSPDPSIILLGTAPTITDASGAAWEPYAAVLQQVAEEQGCLFVDVRESWGDSYGDPLDLMYAGKDDIHPNDAGMAVISAALLSTIGADQAPVARRDGSGSDAGWVTVDQLVNSWAQWTGADHDKAAYRLDRNGRVHFRGLLVPGTRTDNTVLFTLYSIQRPLKRRILNAQLGNSNTCVLEVRTDGTVVIYGGSGATSPPYLSLDGLSYDIT